MPELDKERLLQYSDDFWEVHAGQYNPEELARSATVIASIPEGTRSVLEVGCGNGLIINQLGEFLAHGVDISPKALKMVTAPCGVASASDLPCEDRAFDCVIVSEVLEHITVEEYERSVHEIARVAA